MHKFLDKCAVLNLEGNAYLAEWAVKTRRGLMTVLINQVGKASFGGVEGLLTLAIVGFVIILLLYQLFPSLSTANQVVQTMTETDQGTVTSKVIFGLMLWLFPLGIAIALVLRIFKFGNRG